MRDYGEIQRGVLDYFRYVVEARRNGSQAQTPQLSRIVGWFTDQNFPLDPDEEASLRIVFHDLYIERVIVPGHRRRHGSHSTNDGWPWFWVTQHGEDVLSSNDYTPYDPDGFLATLREESPDIDPVIIKHLEEALGCFRGGYMLAASVMIGCASEKAILLLIDTLRDGIPEASLQKFDGKMNHRDISRKFDALRGRITSIQSKFPPHLQEDLTEILDSTFGYIRRTRNEGGHPLGRDVNRDTVYGGLFLFRNYCKRIYELIDHLRENQITVS